MKSSTRIISIIIILALFILLAFIITKNKPKDIAFLPSFNYTTNDVAIYETTTNDKLTLSKINLDGSSTADTAEFYNINKNNTNEFPNFSIENNILYSTILGNNSAVKRIALDGKEIIESNAKFEDIFAEHGEWISSNNNDLKMEFMPISPQTEIIILNEKNELVKKINIDMIQKNVTSIRPVGFSSNSTVIYFYGILSDTLQGLFSFNINTSLISDIYVSDKSTSSYYSAFDKKNELAYFISNNHLIQISVNNNKIIDIISLEPTYSKIYLANENILIESTDDKPLMLFNRLTKDLKKDILSGNIMKISSDNNYLIYSKTTRTLYSAPSNTSTLNNNIDQNEYLDKIEYRSYNIQNNKDVLLFTDNQLRNTYKKNEKNILFLGLISVK